MKKNLVKSALSLILALTICLGEFSTMLRRADVLLLPAAAAEQEQPLPVSEPAPEQSEGVIRPEEIDEGLSLNTLEDIRGRRVTVRQPVMEVLKDNITRQPTEELPDEYQMLDLTTGAEMHRLAKINFASDPELEAGNKDHPMYPMRGLDRSEKDSNGNVEKQKYFSEFTKYMLLRQAYYFNTHWSDIIKNGQLKKHPAADYIYGKIPDEAKAVKMRIVTDPIYRSPMTTGLYLVPGEVATVKIKGLKKGETLSLYTHHQDTMGYQGYRENGQGFSKMEDYLGYWDDKILEEARRAERENDTPNFEQYKYGLHGQWQWQNQKVPCMGTTFTFVGTGEETEIKIGSMYGGPLYVKPTTDSVELEIEGAVLTPHFVLGVTTIEEFEDQLRNAPGLIATLDVENGQLIGPADSMRNCDDIEKLAYFWHSVFAIDISLNGRDYNYNMTMCYDVHVPAGEAVALNSNFCAQPEYWFPICMNYETLTTKGNWGTFHELGHVQAKTHGVNWGFCDGDGEVWNNTLILLIYSMLCNMDSRVISVEHGEYVHPFTAIERSQKITKQYTEKETGITKKIEDYGQINEGNGAHFDQLSMYATLLHSFGPEKFVDMFYTYKMNPAYCSNKRADFVYRIGVVDRVNILDWVNDNYFANIEESMFTDSQLEFLHNLPDFVPVAYRWANGTDGNETARKYDVDGKHPTVFELSRDNFSSPGEVEVLTVTNPLYGTITRDGEKVTYTPPQTPTEYDRFDIIVKTEGGRRVTLNVNMSLVYKGLYGEAWILTQGSRPTVERAKELTAGKECDYTVSAPSAGISFNHQDNSKGYNPVEYVHAQLKFRAPEAGTYTFYAKADDLAEIDFYRKDMSGTKEGTVKINRDTTSYTAFSPVQLSLSANEIVFIDCHLVNFGGIGHMTIGVHMPDAPENEIIDLPSEYLLSASVSESELGAIDSFKGWQPRFVDSIKNATIDYQNSNEGWKVLAAPVSEGGEDAETQARYRQYMVDGDESTSYHSKYDHRTGGTAVPTPHVFVIDTAMDQTFNYFDIIRRTNGNDKLLSYKLYSCTEDQYANADHGDGVQGWHLLFEGDSSNVNASRQRLSFPRTQLRYFKLIITANSGHTVIREVYAGIESKLNQTVKPSNYMTNKGALTENAADGFMENSANGKLSTEKVGATFEFKFLGNGFELYADTAPDYGKASVTIDGHLQEAEINLSDKPIFNKQVYLWEDTETAEHTVTVTVLNGPFNISFLNVRYGTPVAADEYPAVGTDYGEESVARQFTREWKTLVKDYKDLTSIRFLQTAPEGYRDTYIRIDTYIRLYREGNKIAFVYPGKILAPIECGSLFSGCESLTELVLDNFDTAYMRGAMNMFYGCGSLTTLDVSAFKTENVLSFGKMFGACVSLTTMDLSAFKLDENANLYRMFENCDGLETVKLPEAQSTALRARTQSEESELTLELPYVYQDQETQAFVTEIALDASTAGHTLKVHRAHTFTGSGHPQVDPTCEGDGILPYVTCTTCRCNFSNEQGDTLYRTQKDLAIPALGHDFFYDWPTDPNDYPTCTRPGKGGSYRCSRKGCTKVLDDVAGTSASGHSYELDTSKGDPVEGKTERTGYTVEFLRREEIERTEMVDENGESYYVQETTVIKGIARVTFYLRCFMYSDWTPTEENPLGTPCLHTTQVVLEFECDTHTEETCTENETFFFEFSIDKTMVQDAILTQETDDDIADTLYNFNYRFAFNQVVEGEEAEGGHAALGHKFEAVAAVPATCEGHGSTAGQRCSVCGATEGITSIQPHGHTYREQPELLPTCTASGHGAGKVCIDCGKVGDGVTYREPLGHDFSVKIEEELPTCTKVGHSEGYKCSRCDAIEGHEVVDDLGHQVEVIPGKAPTETESGLTEGTYCPRCGEILEAQEEIPPLGVEPPTPQGGEPPAQEGGEPARPEEGQDENPPLGALLWVIIGVSAAAVTAATAATVIVLLKKRRRL